MRIEETIKVLHDLQKYRRDQHVPSKYPMPHPKRIGEAIDCAIHNMRTCVEFNIPNRMTVKQEDFLRELDPLGSMVLCETEEVKPFNKYNYDTGTIQQSRGDK